MLLYAHNPEATRHAEYRYWLERQLASGEPFLFPELVWAGFIRLATSEVIMRPPASVAEALGAIARLRAAPHLAPNRTDAFPGFSRLCEATGVVGRHVPDVLLAAIAIEHDATLYSADRGFKRFPGLRWQHPLDA